MKISYVRTCALCGAEKDVEEFRRAGWTYDGRPVFNSYCTPCQRRYDAAYNRRNRARRTAWHRAYRNEIYQRPTLHDAWKKYNRERMRRYRSSTHVDD